VGCCREWAWHGEIRIYVIERSVSPCLMDNDSTRRPKAKRHNSRMCDGANNFTLVDPGQISAGPRVIQAMRRLLLKSGVRGSLNKNRLKCTIS
jgi:hypothetical protein